MPSMASRCDRGSRAASRHRRPLRRHRGPRPGSVGGGGRRRQPGVDASRGQRHGRGDAPLHVVQRRVRVPPDRRRRHAQPRAGRGTSRRGGAVTVSQRHHHAVRLAVGVALRQRASIGRGPVGAATMARHVREDRLRALDRGDDCRRRAALPERRPDDHLRLTPSRSWTAYTLGHATRSCA